MPENHECLPYVANDGNVYCDTCTEWIGGDEYATEQIRKVTQLEAELDKWRNWKPNDEVLAELKEKASERVYIGGLESRQHQLEAENEALREALDHCGYDPTDCIDCGGPPHNEHCRFWKLRHLGLWADALKEGE